MCTRPVSSMDRASAYEAGGCAFDPRAGLIFCSLWAVVSSGKRAEAGLLTWAPPCPRPQRPGAGQPPRSWSASVPGCQPIRTRWSRASPGPPRRRSSAAGAPTPAGWATPCTTHTGMRQLDLCRALCEASWPRPRSGRWVSAGHGLPHWGPPPLVGVQAGPHAGSAHLGGASCMSMDIGSGDALRWRCRGGVIARTTDAMRDLPVVWALAVGAACAHRTCQAAAVHAAVPWAGWRGGRPPAGCRGPWGWAAAS